MTFSIIVVCLNAGEKLRGTLESILSQTEQDYEIIVKDGNSTDSVTQAYLNEYEGHRVRVYRAKDTGIYDAMNQAVQYVRGDYIFFLNCGDSLYDKHVLHRVKEYMKQYTEQGENAHGEDSESTDDRRFRNYIFYGNIHECRTNTQVQSNPVIDDLACYRNLPCHQACFYAAELMKKRGFDTHYTVRADYEHFLWCYYKVHAVTVYMPVTIALYEGGGFSETKENAKRSAKEHREIVGRYMPAGQVCRYRLLMLVTLAPVRTWIARNPATAGIYQRFKRKLYRGRD